MLVEPHTNIEVTFIVGLRSATRTAYRSHKTAYFYNISMVSNTHYEGVALPINAVHIIGEHNNLGFDSFLL